VVEAFYWAFQAPGRALLALGATPDAITLTALALSIAAGPVAALGLFGWAGGLVLVGAVLDVLDGMVARRSGKSSPSGELLDSVLDRYADFAPLVGLAVFYRGSVWQMLTPLAALLGSTLISYIRAKAEGLRLELPSGSMRRHERVVYLGVALIIGPLLSPPASALGVAEVVTFGVVAAMAVATNLAALALLARARTVLRGRAAAAARATSTAAVVDLAQRRPWLRLRAWLDTIPPPPRPRPSDRPATSERHPDS
jgi:CDP-diacylglycerol--glycerol-3-phosphate 3-phosphatidyltransferase